MQEQKRIKAALLVFKALKMAHEKQRGTKEETINGVNPAAQGTLTTKGTETRG